MLRPLGLAVAIVILSLHVAVAPVRQGNRRPVIIAYIFPEDDVIDPAQIAADKLTHINYAFANIRDGQVVEGFAKDDENFKVLAGLRRTHPALRILVSVGGWTWSGGFSDAALTKESRQKFVTSAVDFVRRHDLDGFDVDWEYPGLPGNGNINRPEDKENFTALMADLRKGLDTLGRKTGHVGPRRYLLTFAAGASTKFIEHTELDKVEQSVDFVNLMTYDFREAGGDPLAGHHANLYPHPSDTKQRSVDASVREFLAAGVPPAKLVVGVPFYGRAWANVKPDAKGNGLYQPGTPPTERIETKYGSLSEQLVNRNGFVRIWDPIAQGPYLWNAEKHVLIAYDDPQSLALKTHYIRDHHLAGAMFWEYYNDPKGTLLDALFTGLHTPAVAQSAAGR
jgi:chitinase